MTRAERDLIIVARFRAGETRRAIAELFGITPRRVSQIAKEHGIRRLITPGRPRVPVRDEDRALYRKVQVAYGAAYARELLGIAA